MNIQSEKIELIKQIADIDSEPVIKKIKSILKTVKSKPKNDRILSNPMVIRLEESKEQIEKGKSVKITLLNALKSYQYSR